MYKVYKHQNIENGKIYIGITKNLVEQRWSGGMGYYSNKNFFNDILYYGWKNFTHEILVDNIKTEDEAIEIEKEYISKYNSYEDGYNGNSGGKGFPLLRRSGGIDYKISTKQQAHIDSLKRQVICGDRQFSSVTEFAKEYNIGGGRANLLILGKTGMPRYFYDLKLRCAKVSLEDYDKHYKLSPNELSGVFPIELYNVPLSIRELCENMGRKYHHTHHKEYLISFRKTYIIIEKDLEGYKLRKSYTVLGEL